MTQYESVFATAFSSLYDGERISFDALLQLPALPNATRETRKKHLWKYLKSQPDLLDSYTGPVPPSAVIVAKVESTLGAITGSTLWAANRKAVDLVEGIVGPLIKSYIAEELSAFTKGGQVEMSLAALTAFLTNQFSTFLSERARGLVSIAGSINHELLLRSLSSASLQGGDDYRKSGNKSKADIVLYSNPKSGLKGQLMVEVKSYHARERLLRGLTDIGTEAKVGAGFFIRANEFGATSTHALIHCGASAVYMPAQTLAQVDSTAKAMTANSHIAAGKPFYRALEHFPDDMRHFCKHGMLP